MFAAQSSATDESDKTKSKTEVIKVDKAKDEKTEKDQTPQSVDKKPAKDSDNAAKIAVVNGTVITRGTLDRDLLAIRKRFASSGRELKDSQLPTIQKEVLENLINRTLLFQESVKQGIKVDDNLIKKQLDEMKKRYDNAADFEKKLTEANLTEPPKIQPTSAGESQPYLDQSRSQSG